MRWRSGDVFVLCSDGLTDMMEDDDIHLTISTFNANLDIVGQQLVKLANDNGGRDNISVLLARVSQTICRPEDLLREGHRVYSARLIRLERHG